jgi:hypothetical protein
MRYRLRTLLFLLAVGPPALAALWLDPARTILAVWLSLFPAACAAWIWRNTVDFIRGSLRVPSRFQRKTKKMAQTGSHLP